MPRSGHGHIAIRSRRIGCRKTLSSTPVAQTKTSTANYLRIEGGHGRVTDVSKRVFIPNTIYHKTNFYIRESRKYFPGHPLRCFFHFRGMQWVYLAVAVASLPAPARASPRTPCLLSSGPSTCMLFLRHCLWC